jgi:type I restriction enzyme, S subunit
VASQHYVNEGARVVRLGNIGAMSFKDEDRMRDALLVTGAGTAQATLNMGDFRRFRVPVPQDVLALAGRVRALLDWRKAAVAGVETSTSLLQERKRSLITAAVTGGFEITTASSRHTA